MAWSVAILYGFTEGEWHGKRLRKLLHQKGHRITNDPGAATVIIAHSAGSFYVPPLRDTQILVLINPPYWPGKTSLSRGFATTVQVLAAIRPGNHALYHMRKLGRNILYLFRHHKLNLEIIRLTKTYNLAAELQHPRTILIRNHEDPWLNPELERLKHANPKLQIHHIAGGHDDCWQHPEPYLDLLESTYGKD